MKTHIHRMLFTAVLIIAMIGSQSVFAVKHIIHVGNYYFTPNALNVNVGDTIRWQWDAGSHTTTSGIIPIGVDPWDENINSSSQDFEYPVEVAGVHNYVCTPHAGMGQVGSFSATAPAATLSVSPSNQTVTAMPGSTSFSVTSNSVWTTSSNAGWCTVTPTGSGNGTITANFTENTSVNQRIATISVQVTGLPVQMVTVTQAGAAATLSVSPASQAVSQGSGTATFNVFSNSSWTASSNATWCTVTTSGTGNGLITASFTANETFAVRTANISVMVAGIPTEIVTVVQAASTVGTVEKGEESIRVYPNPSKGPVTISFPGESEQAADISLLDIHGRLVATGTFGDKASFTFDLSSHARGVYFIRLKTGETTLVRKLILE